MVTETIEHMVLDRRGEEAAGPAIGHPGAGGRDLDPVGPGGLLTGLTKQVLETALEEELTEHPGYEPGDREGKAGTNATAPGRRRS